MKKLLFTLLAVILSITGYAQRSREYIRQNIKEKGECRNVAITRYNGDLMLYGRNGWAATGCPDGLTDTLDELNDDNEFIRDVQLTDNGSWLVLYGDNGFVWNDIPYSLESKLRDWNDKGEEITSVTFNDSGDWILISKNYISASSSEIQDWIVGGMDEYGGVYATCLTESAAVVVYEEGYKFLGDVPDDLRERLRAVTWDVFFVKIAGTAWFFSDGKSRYDYNM